MIDLFYEIFDNASPAGREEMRREEDKIETLYQMMAFVYECVGEHPNINGCYRPIERVRSDRGERNPSS